MAQTYVPAVADILEVCEDWSGPYAKVRVHCTDGDTIIRWGLDAFTYQHLLQAIRTNGISFADPLEETSMVLLDIVKRHPDGLVECGLFYTQSEERKPVHFACSELFQLNHTWLFQVSSVCQLHELRWKEPEIAERTQTSNRRLFRRVRHIVVAMASFIVIGTVGGIGYWYTVNQHMQGFATQVHPAIAATPGLGANSTNIAAPLGNSPTGLANVPNPTGLEVNHADDSTADGNQPATDNATSAQASQTTAADVGVPQVYKVAAGEVALTFDDGPSPSTEQIVQVLNQYHVHASFFFVGNRISHWSNAVRAVMASGDLVGNHSEDHADLVRQSPQKQAQEVADCMQAIEQIDSTPAHLFRPPYGAYNKQTLAVLKQDHFALALWNRDPRDWAAHSAEDIVNAVLSDHPSGGVFDLHDTAMTLQALPAIIEGLQKQHLKLVLLPTY